MHYIWSETYVLSSLWIRALGLREPKLTNHNSCCCRVVQHHCSLDVQWHFWGGWDALKLCCKPLTHDYKCSLNKDYSMQDIFVHCILFPTARFIVKCHPPRTFLLKAVFLDEKSTLLVMKTQATRIMPINHRPLWNKNKQYIKLKPHWKPKMPSGLLSSATKTRRKLRDPTSYSTY